MKDNELIAEFMNIKFAEKRSFNSGEWTHSIKSLCKFETSWDWLMPVIEKIGTHTLSYTIEMLSEYYYKDGDNQDGLEGIEEFHKAVVFWIKNNNFKTI